jgi:hypothetical protein
MTWQWTVIICTVLICITAGSSVGTIMNAKEKMQVREHDQRR